MNEQRNISNQHRTAALWRWATTICNGPCKVRGKHVRGYEHCDKNPDDTMFGFMDKMGDEESLFGEMTDG